MRAVGIAPISREASLAWAVAITRASNGVRADVSDRPSPIREGVRRVTITSVVETARAASPLPERHTAAAAAARKRINVLRVRMRGLEPPRPKGHTDLNRARLPIPPHPLECTAV